MAITSDLKSKGFRVKERREVNKQEAAIFDFSGTKQTTTLNWGFAPKETEQW